MVSSTKRNGILLIAISAVFAVGIILAITLTKGTKQSSKRSKRDGNTGKFVDSIKTVLGVHSISVYEPHAPNKY